MISTLSQVSWFDLIVSQLWQVSLLIVVVGLVCRLVCRNRPFVAHGLWMLVIVKCLTPPVLVSASGIFCWLPSPPLVKSERPPSEELRKTTAEINTSSPFEKREQPSGETFYLRYNESREFEELSATQAIVVNATPPPSDTTTHTLVSESSHDESAMGTPWSMIGFGVWLSGCLISLFWTSSRMLLVLGRVRRRGVPTPPEVETCLETLQKRLRIRRRVSLVLTDEPVSPVVYGLWQPRLIVSTSLLADGHRHRWESIFAHELVHVRRGDVCWCWVAFLSRTLWWFHPLVHWAARRWSVEAERCCDEVVIAELQCSPATYAHHLLDVFQWKQNLKSLAPLPGIRKQDVTRTRLERIMKLRQGSRKQMQWWGWPVLLMTALVVLPGGAVSVASSAGRPTSQDEAVNGPRKGQAAPQELLFNEEDTNNLLNYIVGAIGFDKEGSFRTHGGAQPESLPAERARLGDFQDHQSSADQIGEEPPRERLPEGLLSRRQLANLRNLQLKADREVARRVEGVTLPNMTSAEEAWVDDQNQLRFEEASTKTLDASPAVSKIEELEECSHEQALARVKEHLNGVLASRSASIETLAKWDGEQLTVTAVNQIVGDTEKAIQRIAAYGLATYFIEIFEYRASKEVVSEFCHGWSFVPSQLPEGWMSNPIPRSREMSDHLRDAAEFPEFDPNMPHALRLAGSRVQTIVSRTVPLRQTHIDESNFAAFTAQIEESQLEQMSFPKVAVCNGQIAAILRGVQRPFVTSVIPVEQNGKQAHVPVITVLESGTAVHVRPIATKSGHVHLDAKLVFSHIGDVEELTFDAVPERDEHGNMVAQGTTLQVPAFTATKVAISTEIPLNGAYVVAGMESPDTDDDRRAVVVIRVRPGAAMNAIERSAEADSEKKTR